jgi:hypothetical protein
VGTRSFCNKPNRMQCPSRPLRAFSTRPFLAAPDMMGAAMGRIWTFVVPEERRDTGLACEKAG